MRYVHSFSVASKKKRKSHTAPYDAKRVEFQTLLASLMIDLYGLMFPVVTDVTDKSEFSVYFLIKD